MSPESKAKGHRCRRCGKVFTSVMRVNHHVAAEHAPRTSADILTAQDILHWPKRKPWRRFRNPGMGR